MANFDWGFLGTDWEKEEICVHCRRVLDRFEVVLLTSIFEKPTTEENPFGQWKFYGAYCLENGCAIQELGEELDRVGWHIEDIKGYLEDPDKFKRLPEDGYSIDKSGEIVSVLEAEEMAVINDRYEQLQYREEQGTAKYYTLDEMVEQLAANRQQRDYYKFLEPKSEFAERLQGDPLPDKWTGLQNFDENDQNLIIFARLYEGGTLPPVNDPEKEMQLKLIFKMAKLLDEIDRIKQNPS